MCAYWRHDGMIVFFLEISSTKGPEKEEDSEVWNGWHHHLFTHLYHLVPTTVHLLGQISCGCGQSSRGCNCDVQVGRL